MKFSVVTVVRNAVDTIEETIVSVAHQTYDEVEHIVIDGASSDGTLDVLRRHESDVAKVVSEPDKGIYDAMNRGLRVARGDFVGFLNADDVFYSYDVLATLADAATGADVIYGDVVCCSPRDDEKILRYWQPGDFSKSRLRRGWMPPHPGFYVRRELALTVGGFDSSFRLGGDYEFMLKVLMREGIRCRYVPKTIVRMRLGGASTRSLSNWLEHNLEAIRAWRVNGFRPPPFMLLEKPARKLKQLLPWRRPEDSAAVTRDSK